MIFEDWFMYALIATLISGLFSFTTKVSVEKNLNKKIVLLFFYISCLPVALFFFFLFGDINSILNIEIYLFAIGIAIFYSLNLKTRFVSLEYLSSSTYFINYRVFSSTLLIFLGIIFLNETITMNQTIGVLIGFLIFYLLLEKNQEKNLKDDLKKGVLFLFYGVVFISIVQLLSKYLAINNYNVYNYLVAYSIMGIIVNILPNKNDLREIKNYFEKDYILIGFAMGFLIITGTVFMIKAFALGNLAIVYKIMSYSLFIPIILSVIIYKEKITLKKIIAFLLTIVSLWFFAI